MSYQILTKINSILKNRLIELLGISLMLLSIFLLLSIASYSPGDPNFIYTPENTEIKNIGGFYGSVISDFLLQSLGLISFFITFNLFYWGLKITTQKTISNLIAKNFYLLIYIIFGTVFFSIFYNDSFWLIDNGNGGFVGHAINKNIYFFTPLIENQYVIYTLFLLAIIFFILSLGIKLNEIVKIFLFPFKIIKKMGNFIKKDKKVSENDTDISNVHIDEQNDKENNFKEKQPILPFSNKKKAETAKNIFKLPSIN